jgi:hypothetical protein
MAVINKTGITNGTTIQAEHVTRAIDALSGGSTDTVIASGSFSGSLIGELTGTASFATTALSSSYAVTASYAENAGGSGTGFPFTGSAQITGSLGITGSLQVSGSTTINGTTNLTGSINFDQAGVALDGTIIGGDSLIIDLTEVGKSPAVGTFIIPNQQPDTPYTGSIYITAGRFYIYDGSTWRQIQFV